MTLGKTFVVERRWGRYRLLMYVMGLILPVILFEESVWFPHASINALPIWLAIGLLLAGPVLSFFAVALSNWSIPMTALWALLIPVFAVTLFIVHWVAGSVLLDRPFLPLD